MKSNPILEETWRIKDELAREAADDIRQLCENTRRWAAGHPHNGPVIHDPGELRQHMATRQQRKGRDMVVREDPPRSSSH
jgi:hypothetical protein